MFATKQVIWISPAFSIVGAKCNLDGGDFKRIFGFSRLNLNDAFNCVSIRRNSSRRANTIVFACMTSGSMSR